MKHGLQNIIISKVLPLLVVLIVLGSVLLLGWKLANYILGVETPNNSNNPSEATGNAPAKPSASGSPSQSRNGSSQTAATGKQVIDVSVTIEGLVKDESKTAPPKIAVYLYGGDKFISLDVTDEEGKFSFNEVSMKDDTIYTLRAMAPDHYGDATLGINDLPAGKTTAKPEIILKSLNARQPPASGGQSSKTSLDAAQLKELTNEFKDINSSLSPLQWLFTAFVACCVIIAVMLVCIAYQLKDGRLYVSDLALSGQKIYEQVSAQGIIVSELEKIGKQDSLNQTLQALSTSLTTVVQQLNKQQKPLTKTQENLSETRTNQRATRHESQAQKQQYDESRSTEFKQSAPGQKSPATDSQQRSKEWYRKLVNGDITATRPVYLKINSTRSTDDPLEQRRVCFNETANQSSFVLFREDESNSGWIFPNPSSNFAADHQFVYADLTADNFAIRKLTISPMQVQMQSGYWQLVD